MTRSNKASSHTASSNWRINIALGTISLLLSLTLAEFALHIAGIEFPRFYWRDRELGSSLLAGASGWQRDEGEAFVEINRFGMRDRDYEIDKPNQVLRVAVLGDSYTAAFHVPIEKSFLRVAEKRLQTCLSAAEKFDDIQFMNFGVNGYGTAQELLMFRHRVSQFDPDIVLLALLTGNDLADNHPKLSQRVNVPYYTYINDELVVQNEFREDILFRLMTSDLAKLGYQITGKSRVLQVIFKGKYAFTERFLSSRPKPHVDLPVAAGFEMGLQDFIYAQPRDPVHVEAWRVTEGLLIELADEVVKSGAEFLLVTLSNAIQVDPRPEFRTAYLSALNVSELFYPDTRIAELADRESINRLILAPILYEKAKIHGTYFHGFENTQLGSGHWNENGHAIAGELIAERICSDMHSK